MDHFDVIEPSSVKEDRGSVGEVRRKGDPEECVSAGPPCLYRTKPQSVVPKVKVYP